MTKALKARLEKYKAESARYRGVIGGHDTWQDCARRAIREKTGPYNPRTSAHGENHARWIEDTTQAGLRFVGYVLPSRHAHGDYFTHDKKRAVGWYCDHNYDDAYTPVVFRLPARKGAARFAYGYQDPWNEGAAFLSFGPCDDENGAQRWACSMAKAAAEKSREFYAKDQAQAQIEEISDQLKALRLDVLALCKEIKARCASIKESPAIAAALRAQIKSALRERETLRNRRAALEDNFWAAVE
jgi:hypothetical protein